MQGRRASIVFDLWLQRYVSSGVVRVILMIVAILAAHVLFIAIAGGVVELVTWLLSDPPP